MVESSDVAPETEAVDAVDFMAKDCQQLMTSKYQPNTSDEMREVFSKLT